MIQHPLPYTLLVFDADGTLRECTIPGQPCPNKPDEWRYLPNVRETLALYDWDEKAFAVISNQAGVSLGYLTEIMALAMIGTMIRDIAGDRKTIRTGIICTHGIDAGCECRKPRPKMLLEAIETCHADKVGTLYVGDMESDRECALLAGVDFMYAADFFGWKDA